MSETQSLEVRTCPTLTKHDTTVHVPVRVCPFADQGPVTIECCGEPDVDPGYDGCGGSVNDSCEFTISQKMRIGIPVVFGASVQIGDTYIECGGISGECGCEEPVSVEYVTEPETAETAAGTE